MVVRMCDGFGRAGIESLVAVKADKVLAVDTGDRVRGVIVTTRSLKDEYDFVSRYFAPWVGIPEDPGTERKSTHI